ncbi:MAG: long-chain fatty acid--CoA ligase [Alphaproteobacteria bacterium]|nr:long-chain fatty acid--CoA ligase [Alphaproteobacteria bacterium]
MPNAQPYPWESHYPHGLRWHEGFYPRPLYTLLDEAVRRWPENIALDFFGKTYSYTRLHEMVNRIATGLQTLGVIKGTRVGLFMPNCPQYVMLYYAILKAGGTVVNFNPLYSGHEIAHELKDAHVEIIATVNLHATYDKLVPFIGNSSLRKIIVCNFGEAMPIAKRALFMAAKVRDIAHPPTDSYHVTLNTLLESAEMTTPVNILPNSHVAVLQYTGGTTGVPKGAMLTHSNLYINTFQCAGWMVGLTPGNETMLAVLPFFHVFAMTVALNLAIANGFTIIIHPKFDLKHVLSDIAHKKPTIMPGVSTLYATINNARNLAQYDLSSIKMCISGGGPLPVEVKLQFEKLTGCVLVEGYGLTESSPVTHCNPLVGVNKSGSIGMPLPGTLAEIIDKDDRVTPMAQGEIGEICISGPQVMLGYLNRTDETENVLRNGRLHTGDLGYMDADGYFYVVDRLKEMIIVGGYNVYPRNVEEEIYAHPSVAECAVIGLDHPTRGQMIKAYLVLKEGAELDEPGLKEHLKPRLTAYALPHAVEFRAALPKNNIGKILKRELVEEEKKRH